MREFTITHTMKRKANEIVVRMKHITNNKFRFTYKITEDGIEFESDEYFKFQDDGVKGLKSGRTEGNYEYKSPLNIPASAFSEYTKDKSHQFAIARSIENKGITPKNYIDDINEDIKIYELIEEIYAEITDQLIYKQLKNKT
jgi:hypothetical protein